MKLCSWLSILSALAVATIGSSLSAADKDAEEPQWEEIFDGKTLDGWDGDPRLWSVEDGAITGRTTAENKLTYNNFIVWQGGDVDNFELEFEYKIINGNSGVQYRSFENPDKSKKWSIGGYQGDFEAGDKFSGILYGEGFRGVLANRGDVSELTRTKDGEFKSTVVRSCGDSAEIQTRIKKEDWNKFRVVANGFRFQHFINDEQTMECVDNDIEQRRASGLLAFQIHVGDPMTIQIRSIRLKRLPKVKKVAIVAGRKSHGFGSHEHRAGCMLLAEALNSSDLDIEATVYTEGWPQDDSVLDYADSIVIYSDGGPFHPVNKRIDRIRKIQQRGVGLVCLHFGVEVPKGDSGDAIKEWIGGYFEPHWSVNPHWTAKFDALPNHPISNGVPPFSINDEWYYHMRFVDELAGVTPILTDLPPDDTLSRPNGPHSGNAAVRASVLERKEAQHVAWAYERSDTGRGFGFTGGHFHWNWGNTAFRTLVLNAIAWTAHTDVPERGVPSRTLTVDDLLANQDYDPPEEFNPARIQAMLDEWNGT